MAVHRADVDLVAGRYARGDRLGHGGFGVVWRAHDTLLQRDVAVKEIEFPGILDEDEKARLREKVLREARAAARLSDPGFVTVFDVIEEDGRAFIVMELVEAPDLAKVVREEGPLSDVKAAALGSQLLDALSVAHEHGIIHRDVKPANVLVHESGRAQLADFGIASILDDPKVTSSGQLAGSPSYMAPEQAENRPATVATDLWGLGATLYYAVEGQPPFERAGAIATLTSVVTDDPRPLTRAGALAPLLRDLLQKDPLARPSAAEVRRRLSDAASPPAPAAAAPVPAPAPQGDVTAQFTLEPTESAESAEPAEPAPDPEPLPAPAPAPPPPVAARPAPPPRVEPERRPVRRTQPRPGRSSVVVPLIILFLVAATVGVVLASRNGTDPEQDVEATTDSTAGESTDSTASGGSGGSGGSASGGSGGSSTRAPTAAASAPADWVTYRDSATGFTIAHPPGWTVQTNGSLTDIRDPVSRAYLRVDYRQPALPSPVGAWEALEPRFAADYPSYQRIRIEPTTFKGYEAAIWEFTYSESGAALHAVDLGFIAGNYGFALNFQTRAADWQSMQPTFEAFKASFKAPA